MDASAGEVMSWSWANFFAWLHPFGFGIIIGYLAGADLIRWPRWMRPKSGKALKAMTEINEALRTELKEAWKEIEELETQNRLGSSIMNKQDAVSDAAHALSDAVNGAHHQSCEMLSDGPGDFCYVGKNCTCGIDQARSKFLRLVESQCSDESP